MKIIESISKKELLLFIDTRILELTLEWKEAYRDESRAELRGSWDELEKLKSYLLNSKADE